MTHDPHSNDVETTDWDVRPIQIAGLALALFIALGLGLSALTARFVTHKRATTDEPAVFAPQGLPPPPRLQIDEAADLALYRRRETALLNSYGWIDRDRGTVRLPIERAMELVAQEEGARHR